MSHIYENPVETQVDLLARIISGRVNIKKTRQLHLHPNTADTVRHLRDYNDVTGSQLDSDWELFENITTQIYNNRQIQ
jgi:hypothetical protein